MKKFYTLLVALVITASTFAQAPEKMSYQAVVRDSGDNLVTSQVVGMRISILQTTSTGTAVYVETHAETTNANGLLTLQVGAGSVQSGTFANIDWSAGPYFVKTETDPAGGATYTITGTQQMMSVPYALYAETSGTGGGSTALEDADLDTKIQVEETTDEDIIRFDIEGTERWVMQGARLEPTNTGNSLFIGQGAGANDDLTDNNNVFVGNYAGYSNTEGGNNTANGRSSLYSNTTGSRNTANGNYTLYYNTEGGNNTANGYAALEKNTTGSANTANGNWALYSNTEGGNNTANGRSSLYNNTTGSSNTANGNWALHFNTTGNYNTANGIWALYSNTEGDNNTANGRSSLYNNTTGYENTANGSNALRSNTTGFYNTALGFYANVATSGLTNATAIGANATVNASNKIQLGDANVTAINTSGTYTGNGFVKAGGTATEFLMADGTVSTDSGTNPGDMRYWNGSSWEIVAATLNEGATLQMIGGVPTWGGGAPLAIGDLRAGGVVFWLDGNGGGLVCALSDSENWLEWGCDGTDLAFLPNVAWNSGNPVGSGAEIGDGLSNTNAIIFHSNCPTAPAALAARGLGSQWFLPSAKELNQMYIHKTTLEAVSGFSAFSSRYWSSTEFNSYNAWVQYFYNGDQGYNSKDNTFFVRAVRAF
jgi:hypothetical protein